MGIRDNLEQVCSRIAAAASAAGRNPGQVRLMAVTKTVSAQRIQEAITCGIREIGENRVQEAQQKQALFNTRCWKPTPGVGSVRWHLIGPLQRNKAKSAVQFFDAVHSVDSPDLIEVLDRQAGARDVLRRAAHPEHESKDERKLEVWVQVNISGEGTKSGCRPEQAQALALSALRSEHLEFSGLMTMPPFSSDPENSRPFFRRLRELRDDLQEGFTASCLLPTDFSLGLLMGMSQDFEVAVEEGATVVRVGSAIFGGRI